MATLYKKNVLIRQKSSITLKSAIDWTIEWINTSQEADDNKKEDGNYIAYYYAELFDSRTTKLLYVFSDKAAEHYQLSSQWLTVLDMTQTVQMNSVATQPLDILDNPNKIPTWNVVNQAVGDMLRTMKVITDAGIIDNGKMKLSSKSVKSMAF